MVEEGFVIEKYFAQIRIDELPNDRRPKFRIGDLVSIVFQSDDTDASYHLKDGIGLICQILFYECKDYGVDYPYSDQNVFYLIEYKILPTNSVDEYRYVSEEHLRKVTND